MRTYSIFLVAILLFGSSRPATAQTEVTFYTNYGEFIVELYDSMMPITTGNFKDLVQQEYYDGVIFHRIIDNFVVQGGDPTGTGSGGPGYTIADEFDSTLSNLQKTIAMANSGPNTGGSQFYFNLVDNIQLDYDNPPFTSAHPIFGIVSEGYEIVDSIGNVPVDGNNRPIDSVVMDSLRIVLPLDTTNNDTTVTSIGSRTLDQTGVHIYPNPLSTNSRIVVRSQPAAHVELSIYNHVGQLQHAEMFKSGELGITVLSFNRVFSANCTLSAGLYVIVAKADGQVWIEKVLVTE